MREKGVLTRLDCAWSRDQASRVYVQHHMRSHARDLYAWIAEGAVIYVCGDAKRMAPDVHQALADVLAEQGGATRERALERLDAMSEEGRYRRDVY